MDVDEIPTPSKTPSQASIPTETASQSSSTEQQIMARLAGHNIQYDINFFRENESPDIKAFKTHIWNIVTPERASGVKPESVARYRKKYPDAMMSNEATFLDMVLGSAIKETYQPSSSKGREAMTPEERELVDSADRDMRDFWDDGLKTSLTEALRVRLGPSGLDGFELVEGRNKASDKAFSQPMPDRCYSWRTKVLPAINDNAVPGILNACINIVSEGSHSFFAIEGKSKSGSAFKMKVQLLRTLATLVEAHRQSLQCVGKLKNNPGIDQQTYKFGATISTEGFNVYVAFAYRDPITHKVGIKMVRVDGVHPEDDDAVIRSRRFGHNILEWGLLGTPKEDVWEFRTNMNEFASNSAPAS